MPDGEDKKSPTPTTDVEVAHWRGVIETQVESLVKDGKEVRDTVLAVAKDLMTLRTETIPSIQNQITRLVVWGSVGILIINAAVAVLVGVTIHNFSR